MCGWFWHIQSSLMSGIYGEKIWVVLNQRVLYCYNNPYDGELKCKIDGNNIIDIIECEFDKLEIPLAGLQLKMVVDPEAVLREYYEVMWGWGDDASKTKGLWRRALVNHHHHDVSKGSNY